MLFVGIDGGGTKTTYLLCREDGSVIAEAIGPGTNINQIGFPLFQQYVTAALERLLPHADEAPVTLFGGFAGGSTGNNTAQITALFRERFPTVSASAGNDAVNALYLGLGREDGIAVIAGTGSSSFVRYNGSLRRVGGWGYLLDPAGSGYAIGRDALYTTLAAEDGRAAPSLLSELVVARLGCPASEALGDIYANGRDFIATFAPTVFEAAGLGCPQAKEIISATAQFIAGLINAGMQSFPGDVKVALVGGLMRQADALLPEIQALTGPRAKIVIPELPPVYGAVLRAVEIADMLPSADFEKNFAATLDSPHTKEILPC